MKMDERKSEQVQIGDKNENKTLTKSSNSRIEQLTFYRAHSKAIMNTIVYCLKHSIV
jgi:hypothetical protein